MEEASLRGRKHHAEDKRTQIQQHGGDALRPTPPASRKTDTNGNKEKLGVDEEHKTEAMRKQHRGTFP